jgi:predicted nucleic acid-binding protein
MVLVDTSVWIRLLGRPRAGHCSSPRRGILASAIVGRLQLWTADPRFEAVANQFGVAYEAPASEP